MLRFGVLGCGILGPGMVLVPDPGVDGVCDVGSLTLFPDAGTERVHLI